MKLSARTNILLFKFVAGQKNPCGMRGFVIKKNFMEYTRTFALKLRLRFIAQISAFTVGELLNILRERKSLEK
jgi:hypothetical protein